MPLCKVEHQSLLVDVAALTPAALTPAALMPAALTLVQSSHKYQVTFRERHIVQSMKPQTLKLNTFKVTSHWSKQVQASPLLTQRRFLGAWVWLV
mmetsp:Transcript_76373/g.135278  ORF Transcript_76373/g.135278 Transcript_76373/m.135278 type:complete len:95 (+) Transcript_76373:334-618(+)